MKCLYETYGVKFLVQMVFLNVSNSFQGALWFPDDGVAMGTDICQSLARGATMNGIYIRTVLFFQLNLHAN